MSGNDELQALLNECDTLRTRVAELEQQLAAAQAENAALRTAFEKATDLIGELAEECRECSECGGSGSVEAIVLEHAPGCTDTRCVPGCPEQRQIQEPCPKCIVSAPECRECERLLREIGDTIYDLHQDDSLANVYCIDVEKPNGAPLDEAVAAYVRLRAALGRKEDAE